MATRFDSLKNICHADLKLKQYIQNSAKVYDSVMKYVFLAIFVLIAAQPLQASSCVRHESQQTSQHGSHGMDHGDNQSMDCCDHDPAVPSDNCDSMSQCGVGTVSVVASDYLSVNAFFNSILHTW